MNEFDMNSLTRRDVEERISRGESFLMRMSFLYYLMDCSFDEEGESRARLRNLIWYGLELTKSMETDEENLKKINREMSDIEDYFSNGAKSRVTEHEFMVRQEIYTWLLIGEIMEDCSEGSGEECEPMDLQEPGAEEWEDIDLQDREIEEWEESGSERQEEEICFPFLENAVIINLTSPEAELAGMADKIVFYAVSEPGAMGAPGTVELVTEEGVVYCTNYLENEKLWSELKKVFPSMDGCRFDGSCGEGSSVVQNGWKHYDLGYGNHLVAKRGTLHKIFFDKIKNRNVADSLCYAWMEYALASIHEMKQG